MRLRTRVLSFMLAGSMRLSATPVSAFAGTPVLGGDVYKRQHLIVGAGHNGLESLVQQDGGHRRIGGVERQHGGHIGGDHAAALANGTHRAHLSLINIWASSQSLPD